jgi:peptidoglycan/xylan/chitin deacetylase (PgdA/CDA1 family)
MKLTILMYHKIDVLPAGVRHPGNFVSPERFAQQMDALLAWGYHTIDFEDWLAYREGRRSSLPDKPLIVTFDDGYTCFDDHAWPALKARGMTATVFLVAGHIGGTNAWEQDELPMRLMNADRILALQREGARFGSHGVTHRPLARIASDEALDELHRSRLMLTDLLGKPVDVFAYPFSNQSRDVRALAQAAGYRLAVRGRGRMNWRHTDPHGLRRIKIEPTMDVDDLRRVLYRERYLRLL